MDNYIDELMRIFAAEFITGPQRERIKLLIARAQLDALHDTRVAVRAFDIVEDTVI